MNQYELVKIAQYHQAKAAQALEMVAYVDAMEKVATQPPPGLPESGMLDAVTQMWAQLPPDQKNALLGALIGGGAGAGIGGAMGGMRGAGIGGLGGAALGGGAGYFGNDIADYFRGETPQMSPEQLFSIVRQYKDLPGMGPVANTAQRAEGALPVLRRAQDISSQAASNFGGGGLR